MGRSEPVARPQVGPGLRSELLEPFDVRLDPSFALHLLTHPSFDLWEEIGSSSFFTTAVQHRALRAGVALAKKLGHTTVASGYNDQADNLLCFQQVRVSHTIVSTLSLTNRRDLQKHRSRLLYCKYRRWSLRN